MEKLKDKAFYFNMFTKGRLHMSGAVIKKCLRALLFYITAGEFPTRWLLAITNHSTGIISNR